LSFDKRRRVLFEIALLDGLRMLRMGHFTAPTFRRIGHWTFLLPLYRLGLSPARQSASFGI
jgi:hypothetical protein